MHACRESMNPRHEGYCDCGQPIVIANTRRRSRQFEESAVREAAYGIMEPDELIARMDARASSLSGEYVSDPGMVALDRDRPREVREELEDAINHSIWWLEDHPDHPLALHRFESLRLLIQAYAIWSTED